MSQEKVNPRLIKSNIDLLQKIVKRPAVTEKILSRPPFRFIFDLTTMIIKTTGYLRGLYTEEEFSFDNVNANKEAKMAFLDKLIDVIGLINSKPVDCKSAKIVAGVEVEKTNKLLNEFAKCVSDKKPFLESVEKVRKGLKQETSSSTSGGINSKTLTKSSLKPKAPIKQGAATKSAELGPKAKKTGQSGKVAKIDPPKSEPTEAMVDDADDGTDSSSINSVRRPSTTTISLESNRNEYEKQPEEKEDQDLGQAQETKDILVVDKQIIPNDDDATMTMATGEELSFVSSSFSETIPNRNIDEDSQLNEESATKFLDADSAKLGGPEQETSLTAPSSDNKYKENSASNNPDPELSNRITTKEDNLGKTSNEIRNDDNDDDYGAVEPQPPPPPAAVNDVVKRLKSSSVTVARSARPKSSRPAPPRVMTASRSRLNQLMENRTGKQFGENSAANGASAASNVWIPETVDDDNDEFLISSQKLQDSFLTMDDGQHGNQIIESSIQKANSETSKGHLVQQLMATKSELEGQIKNNPVNGIDGLNLDKPINDTNQLRNQIQALCQSIGTLTKAMGYLHEDVGPMLDELKKWQSEYQANEKQIDRIRTEMTKDLEPLRKELTQIERQVDDYLEQIHSTKANIYRNEQIIAKLIDSV